MCTSYKLYTSVLNNRLVGYLEDNGIYVDEQNGFRKHRACVDHLYTLTSIIRNRKQNKQDTFSCFIDMRKAFDSVDRVCMFYKLLQCGVSGKLYNSLKHIYAAPVASVMINGMCTKWFPVLTGVRQGDNLSTTLFALFVNDLATELKDSGLGIPMGNDKICVLLYADDIVILGEKVEDVQKLLDIVHKWTSKWRLVINVDKTKVVHFRRQCQPQTNYSFKCGNEQVNIVSSYRYLGCEFNEFLDYTVTAKTLAEASGRAVGSLVNKHKACGGLHHSVFKKYYDACVVPIMDYCGAVWGYKPYAKCDTIQHRALRSFLGLHRFSSNLVIFGDTGWKPPYVRRRVDMIRLWHRLLKMNDNRLTKRVFLWEKERSGANWFSELKSVFHMIGREDLIAVLSPDNINLSVLLAEAEKKLMHIEVTKWKNDIMNSPKLRTYILFKEIVCEEKYLSLSRQCRSFVAQLRCGVLPLHIETGRYGPNPLPPEERICPICKDSPETEIHFIFHCKAYINERNKLFHECFKYNKDFFEKTQAQQLAYIFDHENLVCKLALYIRNAFYLRRDLLYTLAGG